MCVKRKVDVVSFVSRVLICILLLAGIEHVIYASNRQGW
jgi:hypothetical protein